MPPAVIYSGVDDSADIRGSVFAGKDFFIIQRTPLRSHYVSLVESNGGRVVKLESQADYLIADHVRPDAPPGSLSYKFIEKAVELGEIPEDTTPFLAGRQKSTIPRTSRPVASTAKTTRTPFTVEDDRELYAWVKKAEQNGLALKGNELYKLLEEHNPRHTFQSWRERYLKQLSVKPPSGWETYLPSALPRLPSTIPRLPSTASARPSAAASSPFKSPSKQRVRFTDEDDEELEAWVRQAEKNDEYLKGDKIYKELEARNSRHTYQSWRDRWIKVLAPRLDAGDEETPAPGPSRPSPVKSSPFKTRVGFTTADDHDLCEWVEAKEKEGYKVRGTKIYEKLAARNSRHTAESWRSRYIDNFLDQEDDASVPPELLPVSSPRLAPANEAPSNDTKQTPPVTRNTRNNASPIKVEKQSNPSRPHQQPLASRTLLGSLTTQTKTAIDDSSFTKEDFDLLLAVALDIQNICVGRYQEAWVAWAERCPQHTAVEWRSYYERRVLPQVLNKEGDPDFIKTQGKSPNTEFWQTQGQPIEVLPYQERQSVVAENQPAENEPAEEVTPRPSKQLPVEQREKPTVSPKKLNGAGNAVRPSASKRKSGELQLAEQPQVQKRRRTDENVPIPGKLGQAQDFEIISLSSHEPPSSSYHSDDDVDDPNKQLLREIQASQTRPKLTAANLALHDSTPTKGSRGADIVQDDEEDDQGDFANYLEKLLPKPMQETVRESIEVNETNQPDAPNGAEFQNYIDPNLDFSPPTPSPEPQPQYETVHHDRNDDHDIDLEMAEPEGGWSTDAQRMSTQQIYAAQTQQLDLDMPPAPDLESQAPQLQPDSQVLADEEVPAYMDGQMARGYSYENIKEAMRRTSMNPRLATKLLGAGEEGLDLAGVWTEEDDAAAYGADARALKRLEKKHGNGSVVRRIRFLDDWREDEAMEHERLKAEALEM